MISLVEWAIPDEFVRDRANAFPLDLEKKQE
jgi:hypothetical protein